MTEKRMQKELDKLKREKFLKGLDWKGKNHTPTYTEISFVLMVIVKCQTGVQYEADREAKLPVEERYIHAVTTKGDIKIIVTMLPSLIKHIHHARFLEIDYTFKCVHGKFNEWEVATYLDRYQLRKCSLSIGISGSNQTLRDLTGKPLLQSRNS